MVHRCYHALPKTFSTPDGKPSNAVYGFTSILLGILEYEKPDYLAVAFDMHGPTFRHLEFKEYKETRKETEDDLIVQFPVIRTVLDALEVPVFEKEGLEADDYLGMVAAHVTNHDPDVHMIIVTADKDALQLVRDRVEVVAPISGYTKVKRYDAAAVKEKMGVWPEQVPDYKGLCGDNSDNIPGVPGIGPKGAVKLLETYKTLEDIYKNLESVEPVRMRELLREHEQSARMSKRVGTILHEEDGFAVDLVKCRVHHLDSAKAGKLFESLAFRTLLGRLNKLSKGWDAHKEKESQGSLF